MEFSKRIEELVELLNMYNYHYYTLDDPIITDGEYDKLYDELMGLEKKTNYILEDSPTQRIGDTVLKGFEKYQHRNALYSLQKAQNKMTLREWTERVTRFIERHNARNNLLLPDPEYVVELKFDGLTINLTYEDGKFIRATTRGNGTIGEIISAQVLTIPSIPLRIPYVGTIEVQGEGLMPLSALNTYNLTHKEPLKNARNAAAGALRNLDPKVTKERHLTAYFYNINYIETEEMQTQMQMFEFLTNNRFKVHPYRKICKSMNEIENCIREIDHLRHELDILTDGVVIKVNDFRTREALGYTNKFPRWAIAFKFEPEEYSTILKDVVWNVGRTGKVTPTAILEAVEIGNVTIRRATLNNYDDILRKNVRIGSRVLIRRSNDVIPEILGVLKDDLEHTKEIEMPKVCPFCKTELIRNGVHFFCPNSLGCTPQLISRLVHFASRNAMNIEGLSEKTISKMVEILNVREISNIYDIKKEDLLKIPGFKEKKTNNLLQAIEKSKNVLLENFLFAIGIPEVGEKTAFILAYRFKSLNGLKEATEQELLEVEDVGPIMAREIKDFFCDIHIQVSLDHLLSKGILTENPSSVNIESGLSGKVFVLTGSLERYTRNDLKKILFDLNAKVTNSVSKNTDYLIVGKNPGSKLEKAESLNIPIISETEVEEFFDEHIH